MDFNLYEAGKKGIDRFNESNFDLTHALYSTVEGFIDSKKPETNKHCQNILGAAETALAHGDHEEAAHQLRRELFFSRENFKPGNPYERAAQAGLRAIERGYASQNVSLEIDRELLNIYSIGSSEHNHIPQNKSYSATLSKSISLGVEQECLYMLGKAVPLSVEYGFKPNVVADVKKVQYLAEKYIPGIDKYEKACIEIRQMLDSNAFLSGPINEELQPFVEEYDRELGH